MWLFEPSEPVVVWLKVVGLELSPQSTETAHGLSGPGSLKEPRVKACESPSSELWSAAALTVGSTLATSTIWIASESLSLAPSESVTRMATLVVLGPSGKKQSKLPPKAVVTSEPVT